MKARMLSPMRRARRTLESSILAICTLLLSASQVPAQSAITITGQVSDAETMLPLESVAISDECRTATATTAADGVYSITGGMLPCRIGAMALTYSKPGYRFVLRPSFEYVPQDVAILWTASQTVNVEMSPYKTGYVVDAVHRQPLRTQTNNPLDVVMFQAGNFHQDDILFVDLVSLDFGGDNNFDVILTVGQQELTLLSGSSKSGIGGHLQMYGEFSNPVGSATVQGATHFAFSYGAEWPGLSEVTDAQYTASTGQIDWITGPFSVSLRENVHGGPRWVEWQVVRLRRGTLTVRIDIKPGSSPNSINPKSKGVIPVAILTNGSFDATTVDPTTVLFGATGTEAAPVRTAAEDVDGDGDIDLILHFNTQDTGIVCGTTSAFLTGETLSGQGIKGTDSVKTVGCK